MTKKRIEWLDSLRGLAMILVILGHAWALPAPWKAVIYAFHMPLFFAISGCLFRVGKYEKLSACIADKARTLLIPYTLLYLVNIPLQWISTGLTLGTYHSPEELLLGFLTGSVLGYSACWPLWFLPCLFFTSVLFWMLAKIEDLWGIPLWLLMAALLCGGIAIYELAPGQGILHAKTVPMATVFYYLGYLFMTHRGKVFFAMGYVEPAPKPQFRARFFFIMPGLLIAGSLLGITNGKISMMSNIYHNYAFMIASASCTSLGLTMLMMLAPKIKMLDYTGKNSLVFFGFHRNLLYLIENCPALFPYLGSNAVVATAVVWLALFPITFAVNKWCPEIVGKRRLPTRHPSR